MFSYGSYNTAGPRWFNWFNLYYIVLFVGAIRLGLGRDPCHGWSVIANNNIFMYNILRRYTYINVIHGLILSCSLYFIIRWFTSVPSTPIDFISFSLI